MFQTEEKIWPVNKHLSALLEEKYERFNRPDFIEDDPISIPHRFSKKGDIEISGFFAALLAWGQRKTILAKCTNLLQRMDNDPHQFILHAQGTDLRSLEGFRHRTFNDFDLLYTVQFLQAHYQTKASLEHAFLHRNSPTLNVRSNLAEFRKLFLQGSDAYIRTAKHIATPERGSACKRLNMFLRWMVRSDNRGVDFGIWKVLRPSQLVVPCDVHVENTARRLGLTSRPKADWKMAEEITEALKQYDAEDPAKYDFALFGMGVEKYFLQ